jgi:hypothetical protein
MKATKPRKKGKRRLPQNRQRTGSQKLRSGLDPSIGKATRFAPGKSGNPGGRPKIKPILETLREIIDGDPAVARKIAENALRKAARNLGWFTEVRDMLDGKSDGKPSGSSDDPVNFNLNVKFVDPAENA